MKEIFGNKVDDEMFSELIYEQSQGKDLIVKNGEVVAVEHQPTREEKIHKLKVWFDYYFDKQLTQSQWQDDFKVSDDPYFKNENGNPKTYANIDELKAQANIVREEIKRLRQN